MEPLEERKLLTARYVDDNWFDATAFLESRTTLIAGDEVWSDNGAGSITANYGTTAFGSVVGTTPTALAGKGLISDAIAFSTSGDTLTILKGTYKESDILVNKPLTINGEAQSGGNRTLIVPEVASTDGEAAFPVGSHQGFIVNADHVTINNLAIDGSGNGFSFDFHHGITTLYEQQGGGDYNSLHNGAIPIANITGSSDADTYIQVTNVTVTNTYWKGITLSAVASSTIGNNRIISTTVSNIGDGSHQTDPNRVGIQLQNNDKSDIRLSTVTNASVGFQTNVFGTATFDSSAAARNRTGLIYNTATNPRLIGYSINFADNPIDLGAFLDGSIFSGFDANNATTSIGGNSATGLYVNHSQPLVAGGTISGFKTGVKVQNTTLDGLILPVIVGTVITGPGSTVAGSVGILANNDGGESNSASFQVSNTTNITAFQTGIKSLQSTAPGDSLPNYAVMERPGVSGVALAYDFGNGVQTIGKTIGTQSLVSTGSAILSPGFITELGGTGVAVSSRPDTYMPPNADTFSASSISLTSSTTYAPLLSSLTGTVAMFNFNNAQEYEDVSGVPDAPSNGTIQHPYVAANSWNGSVVQNGDGTLVVNSISGNLGLLGGINSVEHDPFDPEDPVYDVVPFDLSHMTTLEVSMKLGASNASSGLLVGLVDSLGSIELWPVATNQLNSSTFTTVSINLLAIGVPILNDSGPNTPDVIDMSNICGYVIAGDLGLMNGNNEVPFNIIFDNMQASATPVSQLVSSGNINLANATLAGTLAAGFTPTLTQTFTIGKAASVTGTFAGLPEAAYTTISGNTYKITYVGGAGHDIVLTREDAPSNTPPVVNLGGANNFTTTWSNAGAVAITSNAASVTDTGGSITSLTASIVGGGNAGDVLTATGVGNITVDAFAGGTLFIHGVDTVANYTTVLKSIKYNNTQGSPLVSQVNVNVFANDGLVNGNTAVGTINIANSSVAGRRLFYNQSGTAAPLRYDGNNAAINAADDNAIATNKTAYLPGTGAAGFTAISSFSKGINGIMIDISGPHKATLTASDFIFRVGGASAANTNVPANWATAAAPNSISIRTGAGTGGSDRVVITWANNAIQKTWLEVIVKAGVNTGLPQLVGAPAGVGDAFFFGNAMGDAGLGNTTAFTTSSADEIGARNNPAALTPNVPITNLYDFNRDAQVNAADQLVARNNPTAAATAPRFINISLANLAPAVDGGSEGDASGVANAVSLASAAPAAKSSVQLPSWLVNRISSIDLNSGPAARLFTELANVKGPAANVAHKILVEIDHLADRLGLDDELLDSLLS